LTLTDSFLPENAGSTTVSFQRGKAALADEEAAADVEVRMDVAEFSSLLAGAIDFETLMLYGLAEISDPAYTPTLQRLFWVERAPVCMTAF
jgi:predicted acetyltransferase